MLNALFYRYMDLQSPEPSGIIDLTNFHLTDGNYTKRKHVFKLTTNSCVPGSPSITSIKSHERELLLQAESDHDMKVWISVLGNVCRTNSTSTMSSVSNYNQQIITMNMFYNLKFLGFFEWRCPDGRTTNNACYSNSTLKYR